MEASTRHANRSPDGLVVFGWEIFPFDGLGFKRWRSASIARKC
jgi:hypothetical protein